MSSKLQYKTTRDDLLYTYKIENNTAIVYDPKGSEVIRGMTKPDITQAEREAWAISLVNQYNRHTVEKIYKDKVSELDRAYVNAELSRIVLSDGNVFSASKTRGENPNRSLYSTVDLIKKAVEMSIYFKQKSITLSDADNRDVTYPIVYTNKVGDPYILPVVELGLYINLFFGIKRNITNSILAVYNEQKVNDGEEIDVDALLSIKPSEIYKAAIAEGEKSIRSGDLGNIPVGE
jgi:hypothetical protein